MIRNKYENLMYKNFNNFHIKTDKLIYSTNNKKIKFI